MSIMRNCPRAECPGVGDEVFIITRPGLAGIVCDTIGPSSDTHRPASPEISDTSSQNKNYISSPGLFWLAPGFFRLGMIMMIIILLNECIYRG